LTVSQLANIEELAGDMIDSVEEDLVREVFQNTASLPVEILPTVLRSSKLQNCGKRISQAKKSEFV